MREPKARALLCIIAHTSVRYKRDRCVHHSTHLCRRPIQALSALQSLQAVFDVSLEARVDLETLGYGYTCIAHLLQDFFLNASVGIATSLFADRPTDPLPLPLQDREVAACLVRRRGRELGSQELLVLRSDGLSCILCQDVLILPHCRRSVNANRGGREARERTIRRSSYSAGTERRERIFSYISGCVNAGSSSSLWPLARVLVSVF